MLVSSSPYPLQPLSLGKALSLSQGHKLELASNSLPDTRYQNRILSVSPPPSLSMGLAWEQALGALQQALAKAFPQLSAQTANQWKT